MFITASRFSQGARDYAEKVAARFLDGETLGTLLVEHNVGVEDDEAFALNRIDEAFFDNV